MTTDNSSKPFGGTRPAKEIFTDFLNTVDDTIQHSGVTVPGWVPKRTAGYSAESCGIKAKADGSRYTVDGQGGPVDDPDKAIQTMKAHWEAKGYTIGNIFTNMGGNTTAQEINATSPSGIVVPFTPGKLAHQ